jgi:hypothetical protein
MLDGRPGTAGNRALPVAPAVLTPGAQADAQGQM